MQKWEYCAISGIGGARNLNTTEPGIWNFTMDGIQDFAINRPEKNEVAKEIAKLGEQGWEMVGTGNTSVITHCIYFKRPKE